MVDRNDPIGVAVEHQDRQFRKRVQVTHRRLRLVHVGHCVRCATQRLAHRWVIRWSLSVELRVVRYAKNIADGPDTILVVHRVRQRAASTHAHPHQMYPRRVDRVALVDLIE